MKKSISLIALFCVLFPIYAHVYSIRFEKTWMADPLTSSGVISFMTEGEDKVSTVSNISNVFKGAGLQIGMRNVPGSATFHLSNSGCVHATKIEIVVNTFDSDMRSLKLDVGNVSHTFKHITSLKTCSLDLHALDIKEFTLTTLLESTAEINIESITIHFVPQILTSLSDVLFSTPNTYALENDLVVMYVTNSIAYVCDTTTGVKLDNNVYLLASGDTLRNVVLKMSQNSNSKLFECVSCDRILGEHAYVPIIRDSLTVKDENCYVTLQDVILANIGDGTFNFFFNDSFYNIVDDYADVSGLEDAHYDVCGIYSSSMSQLNFNILGAAKLSSGTVDLDHVDNSFIRYEHGVLLNPNYEYFYLFTALGKCVKHTNQYLNLKSYPRGVYFIVTPKQCLKILNTYKF